MIHAIIDANRADSIATPLLLVCRTMKTSLHVARWDKSLDEHEYVEGDII